MTVVLAIDPGPEQSAWVAYDSDTARVIDWEKTDNAQLRSLLVHDDFGFIIDQLVLEMVASYGMPVGAEVFETCVWIGRFIEVSPLGEVHRLKRTEVKMHLCHRTAKVTDAVIRQALIDRFGPGKDKAIGRKAAPGPLYGLSGDGWAALAVACTAADTLFPSSGREAA